MREVMNWEPNAFQQFYEGYKNCPLSVLRRALDADTYEAMDRELMAYPAAVAQRNAGMAFNFAKTKAADLTTDAIELRKAAVKALGDDARDLIFIPTTPCTVWDTRFATGAPFAGAIGNGVTRDFYSFYSGSGGASMSAMPRETAGSRSTARAIPIRRPQRYRSITWQGRLERKPSFRRTAGTAVASTTLPSLDVFRRLMLRHRSWATSSSPRRPRSTASTPRPP